MSTFSKTSVDKLGDRLKAGSKTTEDLTLLDGYRQSFMEPYEVTIRSIRDELRIDPTGRPAKSTAAIVRKLRRETIRLSQIQDIAGCRIVVPDLLEQDRLVSEIRKLFSRTSCFDRRINPSHGYRAVHLIPLVHEKPIEIQVRTSSQHRWAELSEILADLLGSELKYGGGPTEARELLANSAGIVANLEDLEMSQAETQAILATLERREHVTSDEARKYEGTRADMQRRIEFARSVWQTTSDALFKAIHAAKLKKQ